METGNSSSFSKWDSLQPKVEHTGSVFHNHNRREWQAWFTLQKNINTIVSVKQPIFQSHIAPATPVGRSAPLYSSTSLIYEVSCSWIQAPVIFFLPYGTSNSVISSFFFHKHFRPFISFIMSFVHRFYLTLQKSLALSSSSGWIVPTNLINKSSPHKKQLTIFRQFSFISSFATEFIILVLSFNVQICTLGLWGYYEFMYSTKLVFNIIRTLK